MSNTPPPLAAIRRPTILRPHARVRMTRIGVFTEGVANYWREFTLTRYPLMQLPAYLVLAVLEGHAPSETRLVEFIIQQNQTFNFPRIDGRTPYFPATVIEWCGIIGEAEVFGRPNQ